MPRVVLVLLASLAACVPLEERTQSFATSREATESSARSWVEPLQLPASARDILLTTNVENSSFSVRFRIADPAELASYSDMLETIADVDAFCEPTSWWPFASTRPGWQRFIPDRTVYVSVDATSGMVHAFRCFSA